MGREHEYAVTVRWTGNTGSGTAGYRAYGRDHDVLAEGKPAIRASADPAFGGDPLRWNPEDALVASLSQCHMLSYLAEAARAGVVVVGYTDAASGTMEQTGNGGGHFTEVTLRPRVTIADPAQRELADALHAPAAEKCFIAASVNFPVRHAPEILTLA